MKDDSAKCTILGMSEFGLVEMTRQRQRGSLLQTVFTHCPYCHGSGLIKNHESTSIEIERNLKKVIKCHEQYGIKLLVHPEVDHYIHVTDKGYLKSLAESMNAQLEFDQDDTLHLNEFHFISTITNSKIEV